MDELLCCRHTTDGSRLIFAILRRGNMMSRKRLTCVFPNSWTGQITVQDCSPQCSEDWPLFLERSNHLSLEDGLLFISASELHEVGHCYLIYVTLIPIYQSPRACDAHYWDTLHFQESLTRKPTALWFCRIGLHISRQLVPLKKWSGRKWIIFGGVTFESTADGDKVAHTKSWIRPAWDMNGSFLISHRL